MARKACRYSGCPLWGRFCGCLPRYRAAPARRQAPKSAERRQADSVSRSILPRHLPLYNTAGLEGGPQSDEQIIPERRSLRRKRNLISGAKDQTHAVMNLEAPENDSGREEGLDFAFTNTAGPPRRVQLHFRPQHV